MNPRQQNFLKSLYLAAKLGRNGVLGNKYQGIYGRYRYTLFKTGLKKGSSKGSSYCFDFRGSAIIWKEKSRKTIKAQALMPDSPETHPAFVTSLV